VQIDGVMVLVGLGVVGVGVAWYYGDQLRAQIAEAGEKVNPADRNNAVNQGTQSVYRKLTGSRGTIGTDLYEWVHGDGETDDETGAVSDQSPTRG
jgi:uncharacterized protein YdgA (DUF945 family)